MTDEDGKQGVWLRLHRLGAPAIVMALLLAVAGVTPAGAQSDRNGQGKQPWKRDGSQAGKSHWARASKYAQSFCTGPFDCCSHQGALGHEKHQRSQSGAIGDHTR